MSDTRPGQPEAVYMARHGRIAINRTKRTVDIVLDDTIRRTLDANGNYDVANIAQMTVSIDPASVIPIRNSATKGLPEMTVPELKAAAAERERQGLSSHNEWVAIHQKFAIPFACVVFGVIGLALGATHRRDGALGSFVLGLIVVFAYYIPLYLGPQLVKGDIIPPTTINGVTYSGNWDANGQAIFDNGCKPVAAAQAPVTTTTTTASTVTTTTVETTTQAQTPVTTTTATTTTTPQLTPVTTTAAANVAPSNGGVLGAETSLTPKKSHGGVLGTVTNVAGSTLPFTGFPVWLAVLIAFALILAGIALRRRSLGARM